MDVIYGECAARLGFTRAETDAHTLRDVTAMLQVSARHERTREREDWRRALILTQATMNIMAKKPKSIDYLANKMLREDEPIHGIDKESYREMVKNAHELAMKKARARNGRI